MPPTGIDPNVARLAENAASFLLQAIVDKEHDLSNSSEEVRDLLLLGVQQIKDDRYEDAIHSFEKAARLDPKNISPRLRLMKIYRATDKDLIAMVVGGGALVLATEPKARAQVNNFLGEISLDIFKMTNQEAHIGQALYFYNQAVDAYDDDVVPLWNRAQAYVLLSKLVRDPSKKQKTERRAKENLERVLRIAYENKGNAAVHWSGLLHDAETGGWFPSEAWWQEKHGEIVALREKFDLMEPEPKASMERSTVRNLTKAALIAASMALAILGWWALPTDAKGNELRQGTGIEYTVGQPSSWHTYTIDYGSVIPGYGTDSRIRAGVEHDWTDLAAVEHKWEELV
jgi:tetratricopeptide (TPR) repeat protein